MANTPIVLCVLDGWGISPREEGNAIALADTPVTDMLLEKYPHSRLDGSGAAVGLPDGQMGNSEVGHTNLGAGRIVYQDFTRISKSIKDGDFFTNPVLLEAVQKGRENALHLIGLVSDGGVHSHMEHLQALVQLARRQGIERLYIHAIMDGRDTPPSSGAGYLRQLSEFLDQEGVGAVATVTGRYFAMDRDKRWDRVEKAFRAMALGQGTAAGADPVEAIQAAYDAGETDEFIQPRVLQRDGKPVATMRPDDAAIFFNFRPDRARELTQALADPSFTEFERNGYEPVHYATMTQYDGTFPYPVAYPPQSLERILPEILAEKGMRQFRIAETEKYAHITFFFNGGREEAFAGEERVLIPSPREVSTYDEKPEMSAFEVTDELVARIQSGVYDFILVNYANHDMVGHTGNLKAAIAASEAIDQCLGRLYEAVRAQEGTLMVTADHGNSEQMVDPDSGEIFTAHTTNAVHFILSDHRDRKLQDGILADVAPTVLDLLDIEKPVEMTGKSLILE